jgi:hypothetical protein
LGVRTEGEESRIFRLTAAIADVDSTGNRLHDNLTRLIPEDPVSMRGYARFVLQFALSGMLLLWIGMCDEAARAQHPVVAAAGSAIAGPKVLRVEGVDAESGIRYVLLSVAGPATAEGKAQPRLTLACSEKHGKRELGWLVTFGGVGPTGFTPPVRTIPGKPKPRKNPDVKLTMDFEGWKALTRIWEVLPSGELRYRNPGMHSPNMESPRVFAMYLNSLPELRIGYASGAGSDEAEEVFATRPLLEEMAKTPVCQP